MIKLDFDKFYTIGHRGNEAYDPENTISAFKRAIDFNVDFIEADLQMTKDEKFVFFHDALLNQKTNKTGKISKYYFSELKDTKIKYFNNRIEKICTFDDFMNFIMSLSKSNVKFIIELKYKFTKSAIKDLINQIFLEHLEDRIIFDSFDVKTLKLIRNVSNQVFTMRLVDEIADSKILIENDKFFGKFCEKQRKLGLKGVSLNKNILSETIVQNIKKNGLYVFGYGIKSPSEYEKIVQINGLNGFTATHPDIQISVRKKILGY